MKKFINIIMFLAIIAGAVSPYIVGMMLEKNFNRTLAHLNTLYDGEYKFTSEYTRGYAKSSAIIHVAKPSDAAFKFNLSLAIQHGPVIFEFHGWPNPATYVPRNYRLGIVTTQLDDAKKFLDRIYGVKPAYTFVTTIDFNGNLATVINNFPIVVPMESNEFDWGGMTLTVNSDVDLNNITGDLIIPKLAYLEGVQDPQTQKQVAVKDIKLTFNSSIGATTEHADINVGNVSITEGVAYVASVDKLDISINNLKLGDLVKSNLIYNIDKITIEKDQYGPLAIQLKLNNLNAKVMQDFAKRQNSAPSQEDAQNAQQNLTLSQEELLALLTATPGLDLTVKFTTPKGKIDFNGSAVVGGKDIQSVDNATLLKTADVKMKFDVSQPIVYELLAQYVEDQLKKNEREFFLTNKDPAVKNPYTLPPAEVKSTVEGWIIAFIEKMKLNQIITEKENVVSVDASLAKGVWILNGKNMTDADWNDLKSAFGVILVAKPVAPPVVTTVNGQVNPNAPADTAPDNATQTMEAIQRGRVEVIPAINSTGGTKASGGGSSGKATTTPSNVNNNKPVQAPGKPATTKAKPIPSTAVPTPTSTSSSSSSSSSKANSQTTPTVNR